MKKDTGKVNRNYWWVLLVIAGLFLPACAMADELSVEDAADIEGPAAAVPVSEILDNVSVQFSTEGRVVHGILRAEAAIPPPTNGTVTFPAALFDGFQDGGVKSFFGAAGLYTESFLRGAPLLITNDFTAFFNLPRAARLVVNNGVMTVTVTGSPLPEIPAGVYTMNFLPGVFNLTAGAHEVGLSFDFEGGSTVQMQKLLLVDARVIPHLGMGVTGALRIVSFLVLNNPNGQAITVQAQFFGQDGAPMEVTIDGNSASTHDIVVAAESSQVIELSSAGPVQVGWALLSSSSVLQPFQAAVVFSNEDVVAAQQALEFSGANLRTEAGVAAAGLDTRHVLHVVQTADGIGTAFAVVNPTSATAEIDIRFTDSGGGGSQSASIELGPRQQRAEFFFELFGFAPNQAREGDLLFISDADIGVMSLKTLNGEQTSSLPSGTP